MCVCGHCVCGVGMCGWVCTGECMGVYVGTYVCTYGCAPKASGPVIHHCNCERKPVKASTRGRSRTSSGLVYPLGIPCVCIPGHPMTQHAYPNRTTCKLVTKTREKPHLPKLWTTSLYNSGDGMIHIPTHRMPALYIQPTICHTHPTQHFQGG